MAVWKRTIVMKSEVAKFSICSLCLHFAVISLFSHVRPFEYGSARINQRAQSTVAVRLVPGDEKSRLPAVQEPQEQEAAIAHENPGPQPTVPAIEEARTSETESAAPIDEFLSSGQLTQRPTPLSQIDLNIDEISEIPFSGTIDLTIRIDIDGSVVDVTASTDAKDADEFIEQVSARFKKARFTPGEINGRPVRSQLRVTVFSETVPSSVD